LQPYAASASCRQDDPSRSPAARTRSVTTSSGSGSGSGNWGGGGGGDGDGHEDGGGHDGDHSHREGGTFGITSSFSSRSPRQHKWNQFPDGSRFWKPIARTMRKQRPIFVAATRQHVGKTTTSLAIMSGLKKRYDRVGFLKPVGQQHVPVISQNRNEEIRVDKDCVLVREHFQLKHIDYEDMSPVIIPQGYTKKFVDGEISLNEQIKEVHRAMENVAKASDVVLLEGTGHCAVGSIVGLNNAKVASLVGADMVLVANGGLGSAFDELELNRVLCQHFHVRIAGVIINKVIPDKYESTKVQYDICAFFESLNTRLALTSPPVFLVLQHYMGKAMMQAWGVPLLGCIPDRAFLGMPALADLENLFKSKLVSGKEHRFRHYNTSDINVVTTSLTRFLENLREKPPRYVCAIVVSDFRSAHIDDLVVPQLLIFAHRTLYICHVTRDDLIVGFLGEYQRRRDNKTEAPFEAALVVCGRKGKYQLSHEVEGMLNNGTVSAPVMCVGYSTHDAMSMIHRFTPKLNIDDTNRVAVATEVRREIDSTSRAATS
jgi:dethiobiotin synthetase